MQCNRLTLMGSQTLIQLLSHSPLLSRTWGKNKMKKLVGQDKDRKITQLLSWAK